MKNKLFLTCCLAGLMLSSFTVGVSAGGRLEEIKAYLNHGITIEYNDVDQDLKDSNGNRIYPITYNGTTYLPIRAISELLDVKVGWDSGTNHVLLGDSYVDIKPTTTQPMLTENRLDFHFISDAIAVKGNGKVGIAEYDLKHIDSNGFWHGYTYGSGSDVAYGFSPLHIEPVISGVPTPELKLVEDYICNSLVADGYQLVKIDDFGSKHYVKGNVEFKVWNINNTNTSLSLEVNTKWLGCCLSY